VRFSSPVQAGNVDVVITAFTSDEFVRSFADELEVTLLDAAVLSEDGVVRQVLDCSFSTHDMDVPGMVRKVLPGRVRLTWDQTWRVRSPQEAHSDLLIYTHGKPSAKTTGIASLVVAASALDYSFEGSTSVSVPLVGGKLADLVDDHLIRAVLSDQVKVLNRHLGS